MVYCLAMNVRDKVVIVTGASAGIGLATAKLLAKQGAKVALAARSQEKLQELSQELASSFAIPTDMSDATSVGRTVAAVHENYGRIDALINNAGRGLYGTVEKVDVASYQAIWALNVEGPLIAMQKAIPLMRAQGGGSIVNISSMVSKNYFPRIGAYVSFPKIISGRIGGAVQPGSEWRQWRQIVGLLDEKARLSVMPSACALDCNTPHKWKELAADAPRRK